MVALANSCIVVLKCEVWYNERVKVKQLRKGEAVQDCVPIATNRQLNNAWKEHVRLLLDKGITPTFKPVRFYTSDERDRLVRETSNRHLPPTIEEVNKYP